MYDKEWNKVLEGLKENPSQQTADEHEDDIDRVRRTLSDSVSAATSDTRIYKYGKAASPLAIQHGDNKVDQPSTQMDKTQTTKVGPDLGNQPPL